MYCTLLFSCAKANLKKVSLELGGKSPLIIFSDCDLDKAVRMGCGAVFFNKGENCIAAGRLFVEESIHDEFLHRVVSNMICSFLIGCLHFSLNLLYSFLIFFHFFFFKCDKFYKKCAELVAVTSVLVKKLKFRIYKFVMQISTQ